jgi:transcriptional/translational regulatory protein YebC/TACO1
MSGHSKWSTIKHQKGLKDKRRGALFSKMAKAISIAAREGPDSESNFKLRLAIDKAKEANVPKTNIERAIASGSRGAGGEQIDEATYEGYCRGGDR